MLKDTSKEIMIITDGSWVHPRASPKRVKIAEKEKWQKSFFFNGKSKNGMRNDMAFVQVIQSHA